jgi:hypothetical protein
VYASLDFANPFVPGAVSVESGFVEAAGAVRRRILPSVRHEMPSLDPASPAEYR